MDVMATPQHTSTFFRCLSVCFWWGSSWRGVKKSHFCSHFQTVLGWRKKTTGVVVSNMFYFHPDPWENDPIWRAYYFSIGLKPPTRKQFLPFKKKLFDLQRRTSPRCKNRKGEFEVCPTTEGLVSQLMVQWLGSPFHKSQSHGNRTGHL